MPQDIRELWAQKLAQVQRRVGAPPDAGPIECLQHALIRAAENAFPTAPDPASTQITGLRYWIRPQGEPRP